MGILVKLASYNLRLYGPAIVQSLISQATGFLNRNRYEEALSCLQDALDWLSKISPRHQQEYPFESAFVFWFMAKSYHHKGQQENASEYGRRALEINHTLVYDRPLRYAYTLTNVVTYS